MRRIPIFIVGTLFLAACGLTNGVRNTIPQPMMGSGNSWGNNGRYDSNGERIYFTSTDEQGEQIQYSGRQNFGGMMGIMPLACSSCHGPDGRGGIHTMHMDVMDAPDIRYSALSGESEEHDDASEENGHGDEHREYNIEGFRQAVVEGKHPNGDDLSRDMPRWQLNDQDLYDLFEYLKSFP